jgi:hypothetical protein
MAKRVKHLVKLDIKAVVLECKVCASSLSISIARSRSILNSCPVCGASWDQSFPTTGFNAIIGDYITRHKNLQDALEGQLASSVGYRMNLEVDLEDPSKRPADTPASDGA